MSNFIERLFGGAKPVSNKNIESESSEAAFDEFMSEENLETKHGSRLHVVSEFEKSADLNELQDSDTKNVSDKDGFAFSYDPARLKRETFVENVTKDIAALDDALTKNELYISQSREQLKRFKAFAQNAEIDIDVMYRLRAENKDFVSNIANLQINNDKLQAKLEVEKANSSAALNRFTEVRSALETAREEIVTMIESDTDNREKINNFSVVAVQRENELLQANRTVERVSSENQSLYGQCERFVSEMDVSHRNTTELEKSLEETAAKLNAEQVVNEKLASENKSHVQNFDLLQSKNVELNSRLQSAQHEAMEVEKRAGDTGRITGEELYSLRSRVERLQSQLRVKSQVNSDLEDNAKTAYADAKVSKEAARDLHDRLVEAIREREQDQNQVSRLNNDISEQNNRFDQLLVDLEGLRQENTKLRRSLKIQKQIWGGPINESVLFEDQSKDQQELEDAPVPPGSKTH